jgi:diguanylate cyclase (GGDEF)-like protein/PAS domain S-box-containing protein
MPQSISHRGDALIRNFVENAAVPCFVMTFEGKLAYANRASCVLLGYSRDELIGRDFRTLVHADDVGTGREQAESLVAGTIDSYQVERRYVRKDGEAVTVLSSVTILDGDEKYPPYFSVQAIDITRQKLAEASLAESERRWLFALESAGQGVWEADIQNNSVYYSPVWKRMRGYAPDDFVDSSQNGWLKRVHPDDRARIEDITRKQDAGEIKRNAFEYREWHKDGYYIWISSRGAPNAWDKDGAPTRVIGTDTDITQIKLAEQREQELAHRLKLALGVAKIGVFEGNLKTGELYWDARIHEIFGVPADLGELRGSDWEKAVHPDDLPLAMASLNAAVAAKGTFNQRYRIIRPDGEVRTVAAHGTYYADAEGTPKIIGANSDITEEVALAEGLRQAGALAEARNVELEAAKARIEAQSLHDALTGLPNRRYLDEILAGILARGETRDDFGLAVLHIDLDRFKEINDTLGHSAGDALLQHIAKLMLDTAGAGNFVSRVGGDEFVMVCLTDTDQASLAQLAERIIRRVQKPVLHEGHSCRVGASIGIAVETGNTFDPRRLLVNADMALYRAKDRGRNRYEFFTRALQEELESNKRIADDILRGIEANEFVPFYQPLIDARTLDVVGAEALVRWAHPVSGILTPDRFLKIAEDLDVVAALDRAMLESVLADLELWRGQGLALQSVSVNVSFRRLNDENLLPSLRQLGIRPGTISFEFLESIFLDELDDQVAWNIDAVKDLGIAIDVDDFGTGHTSFVSLLKLNPRRLKIDRQLVGPIAESIEQQRLVKSIIEIGRTLGIEVVAEGVETQAQAECLTEMGCDYLQGYLFGKPMTSANFAKWLGTWDPQASLSVLKKVSS